MKKSAPSRIINVSSSVNDRTGKLDLSYCTTTPNGSLRPIQLYSLSKLYLILHAKELGRRLKGIFTILSGMKSNDSVPQACVKNSVHWGVPAPGGNVPAPGGVCSRGVCLLRGVPAPGGLVLGGLQALTQGGSWGRSGPGPHPRGKLRGSGPAPPPQWLLLRAVRILLECILVVDYLWIFFFNTWRRSRSIPDMCERT